MPLAPPSVFFPPPDTLILLGAALIVLNCPVRNKLLPCLILSQLCLKLISSSIPAWETSLFLSVLVSIPTLCLCIGPFIACLPSRTVRAFSAPALLSSCAKASFHPSFLGLSCCTRHCPVSRHRLICDPKCGSAMASLWCVRFTWFVTR